MLRPRVSAERLINADLQGTAPFSRKNVLLYQWSNQPFLPFPWIEQRPLLKSIPVSVPLSMCPDPNYRPVLFPIILTQQPNLLLLGLTQLVWLDQGLDLEQCLIAWLLVMLGTGVSSNAVLLCQTWHCPLWGHEALLFDGCLPHPHCHVRLLGVTQRSMILQVCPSTGAGVY